MQGSPDKLLRRLKQRHGQAAACIRSRAARPDARPFDRPIGSDASALTTPWRRTDRGDSVEAHLDLSRRSEHPTSRR